MLTYLLRIFVFVVFAFAFVKSRNQQNSILRIYSNLAEIIRPLDNLPLEFTSDDWYEIRSDSITLLGKDLNITSQIITEKKKSFNGAQVYIRSPISMDKTSIMFAKATLVDENQNLVKIQDESVPGKEALYFTIPRQDIFYMEQPSDSKFYVDFTYDASNSKVFVSYLRSNFNWRTQYQLNLHHDKSDLIAMANIRNDGKSAVSVDQAELFSGDINLHMQRQQYYNYAPAADASQSYGVRNMKMMSSGMPTIEQGEELMGVHVFPINKPFSIDAKTNYLLPMFRPQVSVERYKAISKGFSTMSNNGKAQRSYRLRSDRYLSQGNCIIREHDRVVGETSLPNIGAKNKHEFSIGEDADIVYKENVTLISSEKFQEQEPPNSSFIVIRTRSIYKIQVQVKNLKSRSVKVEYTQTFYSLKMKLINSTDDKCHQEDLSVKFKMALNANDEQVYSYAVRLVDY